MVKILVALVAALSILNSSGASPGATEKAAALVARATCSGASHSSVCVLVPSIHSFFYLTTALLKSDVSGTQTTSPPTVFNLQASNCVHCEEETSAN